MAWHVRQNRALHEHVLALTLTTLSVPWTDAEERLTVKHEADHFWRAEARIGFMERPDIPAILAECKTKGVGHRPRRRDLLRRRRNHRPREDGKGMPRWQEALVRRDGPQRRADQRLSPAAARPGGRDRPRDRDLKSSGPRLAARPAACALSELTVYLRATR